MKRILLAASALAAVPAFAQTSPPPQGKPAVATTSPMPPAASPVPVVRSKPPAGARYRRKPSAAETRVRAANARATQEPATPAFVNAVQVYSYGDGVLYRLFAAPERITDIALQPGEAIVSVAAGDTARWTVGDTTSGAGESKRVHILVKPFASGLSTNLVITTDRRAYHLQLTSTSDTAMTALSWTYPQDELIAIRRQQTSIEAARPVAAGLTVEQLNFGYAVTGDRPAWRPLRAFDDGRQTFIEFPAGIGVGEAPPLFVIGEQGDAQLVNYRMSGRFYVIDRLFDTAELRLGAKKQAVVRIDRIGTDGRRRQRRVS
ncbi:P-type conjugative transfer protein TrbG [Sphingomonas qomolangmaensis]|uniref:P-type conjugative transfer protein TrbG n=1 Tax=Sphingomonas qomolangmaensis TaxID=2918765 RepID=A0ABY5L9Q4_9SPHN|nr:P-type conjugative transfer protein TrbG [Sphingomonas qomolangmaensis]UUL82592.1 P-type conjugative transfer protein TrbG [Sphingomonas qomolangmaensis]